MDYSRLFSSDSQEDELIFFFIGKLDRPAFESTLKTALSRIGMCSEKSEIAIGRVFTVGVAQFTHYVNLSERDQQKNDQPKYLIDVTLSNHANYNITPLKEIKSVSATHITDFDDKDGEDITELVKPQTDTKSLSESFETVDLSELSSPDGLSTTLNVDDAQLSSDITNIEKDDATEALSHDHITTIIAYIADVLAAWFVTVSSHAVFANEDVLAHIFGPPGSDKNPNDSQMFELLVQIKTYLERAIERNDLERAGSLRKLVILIHEILHALFVGLSLETGESNFNDLVIVKSLLFCFFQVDFSEMFQSLLVRTTGRRFPLPDTESSEKPFEHYEPKVRLSYDTVMKIYGICVSLQNCPIEAILVDKISLSLDIATPQDISPNTYRRFIESLDFELPGIFDPLNTRLVSQLAAIYNYYYEMSPDILRHSLRHSSFFGWITKNALSSGRYLSTDTTNHITTFTDVVLDLSDPFLYEVHHYEHKKKLKNKNDSEAAVRSVSYLVITFQLLELLKNKSFTKKLITNSSTKVPLFDLWLCVSSYVHHYQFRSPTNSFGSRVSLLLLLKLTSPKSPFSQTLHDYKVDENKWKLCHHKHPVIPLDENCPEKDLFLYLVDILQVTFRYNLSMKLDPENAKIALTVLYQILLQLEAHPSDGIRTYAWNELYSTLLKFLLFVSRNDNEEGVKYVIEEIFSIFQLLLGPVFHKVVEKSSDFFSFGYHPVKSMNFDLLYLMLQQHTTLEALFNKYFERKDNFDRVQTAFANFSTKLASVSSPELHSHDVTKIINELSGLKEGTPQLTTLDMGKFNYADTFKYLGELRDYEEFPKQKELLEAFISIFETNWLRNN